jgi:hypothetical protein
LNGVETHSHDDEEERTISVLNASDVTLHIVEEDNAKGSS